MSQLQKTQTLSKADWKPPRSFLLFLLRFGCLWGFALGLSATEGRQIQDYPVARFALAEDGHLEALDPNPAEPLEVIVGSRMAGARWVHPSDWPTRALTNSPQFNPAWQRNAWRVDEGLPENDVKALCQTPDGYLWVGTPGGLARFDGNRFTVFNEDNSPALSEVSHDIRVLRTDHEGRLWVGARQGLARLHRGSWEASIKLKSEDGARIRDLCIAGNGQTWVATDLGIRQVIGDSLAIEKLPPALAKPYGGTTAVFQSHDGYLWVTSPSGLLRWHPHRPDPVLVVCGWEVGSSRASCFAETRNGTLWVGAPGALRSIEDLNIAKHCLPSGDFSGDTFRPHRLCLDPQDNPWVSIDPQGTLCRLEAGQLTPVVGEDGESIRKVQAVLTDSEGNIWCGTAGLGLLRLKRKPIGTLRIAIPAEFTSAVSVSEGPHGEIWMGTQNGAVSWWSNGAFAFEYRLPPTWGSKTYALGTVPDTAETWASFAARGMVELGLPPQTSRFETRTKARGKILSEAAIRAFHWTSSETAWLGTTNGLYRMRRSGDRTRFPPEGSQRVLDVRTLQAGKDGRLWFGLKHGGLACIENADHAMATTEIRFWTRTNDLPGSSVWCLHRDKGGTMWIGTDKGLASFRDGRIASFGNESPIRGASIHQILEDDQDRLWFSHSRGICCARRSQLTSALDDTAQQVAWSSFGETDGMPNAHTAGESQPAGCKSRDGRLYFPTAGGLAVIDPRDPSLILPPPRILIQQVLVDGQPLWKDAESEVAGTHSTRLTLAREPKLSAVRLAPYQARDLRIRFTSTSLTAPERLRFEYRLLGLESAWRSVGAERMAFYTNLKPGDYRFQVRAANHQGTGSLSPAEWSFTLAPGFRQTAYFYLVIGLSGLAIAATFTLWRLSWQRKVLRLEQRVALDRERKRIARDMHDDLGAQLSTLALQLHGTTEQTARESMDTQQRIRDVIRHLNALIWQVEPGHESVVALADFIGNFAQDFLGRAGLRLHLDIPEELSSRGSLAPESRRHVVAVVKEALRNVVRHAQATLVTLRMRVSNSRLTIEISDDGCGFDRFHTPENGGLVHMRERLSEIGGECVVDSTPGSGTSLRFTLDILEAKGTPGHV